MFMIRLILFLIRRRLHLKPHETFRFRNQNSLFDYYYFTKNQLLKVEFDDMGHFIGVVRSGVSLNWLLDPDCEVLPGPLPVSGGWHEEVTK